ncbi:uncharacterized protein LOC122757694 [Drosophila mojavensis]|uniref:uncharacterized protein LOC122757694 n=1 Tax=Drosophila mojavensis TaxID=7230 RepID=UPI001CD07B83|nr:uncharacterized protein LOC122757694 [Drosophila mojavensis]
MATLTNRMRIRDLSALPRLPLAMDDVTKGQRRARIKPCHEQHERALFEDALSTLKLFEYFELFFCSCLAGSKLEKRESAVCVIVRACASVCVCVSWTACTATTVVWPDNNNNTN